MPLLAVPFLIIGFAAKIANRRQTKRPKELVHSNHQPQLKTFIEVVTSSINSDTFGRLYQNEFFSDYQKTTVGSKN